MSRKKRPFNISLILLSLWILVSQACLIPIEPFSSGISKTSLSPRIEAEVVFRAEVPLHNEEQILYLDILDEVTGLALNPARFELDRDDDTHYSLHLSIAKGTFLKYRYLRKSVIPLVEYNAQDQQVRYRSYYVDGPAEIKDFVAGWQDTVYHGPTGRLQGQVFDGQTNAPLSNMMISVGGYQIVSSEDGTFGIDHLPIGTHLISVFSKDGDYLPFQQGVLIAEESLTPATIRLKPLKMVQVQFNVEMPANFATQMPVRIVGNIAILGNTFEDLRGGVNVLASKAPVMQKSAQEGKYTLLLKLPAGLDLRYKYTLGDGFWNAELDSSGKFRVRQLIVPDHDIVIDDTIAAWEVPETKPITFTVDVPENIPGDENIISLQLNPYGWMEPIPMMRLGENSWTYTLYSPLHLVDEVSYRYCLNGQCETESGASLTEIRTFFPSATPQRFEDSINIDRR